MADPSVASAGERLPTGTVTFFFSDIVDSTPLWERYPEEMKTALAKHDAILKETIASNHGQIIKSTGDGVHSVFATAIDAIHAAIETQRAIRESTAFFENLGLSLSIRIGMHTGEAELRDGDYYGQALNRSQRIMSIAHGGQILVSDTTAQVAREHLPKGVSLLNLGEHHLRGLLQSEQIFQLIVPDLEQAFPPLKSVPTKTNNLPTQVTSFIGREKEKAEIQALLDSRRLVTLTGSGGTGKTRLSQEVGAQMLSDFPHGVWIIELAPLTDPSQIIPSIAQVFGLQEHPFGPLSMLVMDYLRDKKLLLILDNCEHLIEACARIAGDLLQKGSQLRILASSREALGIAGEITYHTPSLAETESTRLFVERARVANPRFSLTDSNASSIAQICARLDGIPLAIELAAARTKLLSVDQIAARLDDRFRLLVGGSRTALPRQQTLRALIDWSYDLLSEEEKALFRTASVFVGGWTLDALEAVADDPNALEHLEQLVNKSLVVTEERKNEMRYFMLETIRQYAREKLFDAKQAAAARDRHFFYYDELAEKIWKIFQTENIHAWRDQADDEVENFRTAVEWGLESHAEQAIRLAANFCLATGGMGTRMEESLTLCRSAINRVKSLPPVDGEAHLERQRLLAKALFAQGLVGLSSGNLPLVIQDLQEAIATARAAGDKFVLGYSLEMFFTASRFIDTPGAEEAVEEGYRIFRDEVHDNWGLSMAYQNKARIAAIKGNSAERQEYLTKFRELIKETPLSLQAGLFCLGMGINERVQGNFEAAKNHFEEGLNIFKHIRNSNFELVMRSELAHNARHIGKIVEARKMYEETLRDWQNLGNRGAIANQLESFAFLAIIQEEPQRAAKLLGAAEALREKIQSPMTDYEQIEYGRSVAQLRSMLTETELNSIWSEGRLITMDEAIQFALGHE